MSWRPFVIRVSASCRLHFGLFHVPTAGDPPDTRRFGGVGLMVRPPAIEVAIALGDQSEYRGPLGERGMRFVQRIRARNDPSNQIAGPLRVLARGPAEHVGLGVGTALGLAVAAALHGDGDPALDGPSLAPLVGRGERSAVGSHGFSRGGLLLDNGRVGDEFPSLADQQAVPNDWRVVLVRPAVPAGWYGERERAAFARNRSPEVAADTAQRLRSLATDCLFPAARHGQFDKFAQAVTEFNRLSGEPFAADQGGVYASPSITRTVELLQSLGVVGCGQSSWGPTVFAFTRDITEAEQIRQQSLAVMPDADVQVSVPDNHGADLHIERDHDQLQRFENEWLAANS